MSETDGLGSCDWPNCPEPAGHALPIRPGMTLTLGGVAFEGSVFRFCDQHAPRTVQVFSEALDDAVRRHAARTNFAPGDAEWMETFGTDDR